MRKRILVAVLDWGIGHATRMIPVITHLRHAGCDVVIGGNGRSLLVLQNHFPDVPILNLPGYGISYRTNNASIDIALQIPKLFNAITAEKKIIDDWLRHNQVDCILSDNRYGIYSSDICSVFVSHQLNLVHPPLLSIVKSLTERLLFRLLKKFHHIWVPDSEQSQLSGTLSKAFELSNLPVHFIGPLSRLNGQIGNRESAGKILCLLSGPEPLRTRFEEYIIKQTASWDNVTIVCGNPEKAYSSQRVIAFADSKLLESLISQSSLVIARSGYSTVMDLCRMNANAVLIPTPGQTEQEYLATHLSQNGYCKTISQRAPIESSILETAYDSRFPALDFDAHKLIIDKLLIEL